MNFLLNRGGAGKSLSRAETVAQASSLITRHIALLRSYDRLVEAMAPDDESVEQIRKLQKQHRADIAKLCEIVLSANGTPPREAAPLEGSGIDSLLRSLTDGERSLREELEAQLAKKHHMRTIAVLETLLANTEERIGILQTVARTHSVPVS